MFVTLFKFIHAVLKVELRFKRTIWFVALFKFIMQC